MLNQSDETPDFDTIFRKERVLSLPVAHFSLTTCLLFVLICAFWAAILYSALSVL